MRLAAIPSTVGGMETSDGFGTPQLFRADFRLALASLNHLRYQALKPVFGISREQANVHTVVLPLSAAEGIYETARRISPMRLRVSGTDALLVLAIRAGLAPALKRTAQTTHTAEQRLRRAEERVRRARIRRYVDARDHVRASAQ